MCTSSRASTRSRTGLTIGHEPVGVIEKLGSAVRGYREGQRVIAGAITPERLEQCVPLRRLLARRRRHRARLEGDGRLEVRQHHRRLPGRVCAGARRHGQPGAGSRRTYRRAGADVPGHHVHRLQRRGERPHPHRRHGGGVRAGTDRPVRDRRRQAQRAPPPIIGVDRVADAPGDGAADGRRPCRSTSAEVDPVAEIMRLTDGRGVDVAIEALEPSRLRGRPARAAPWRHPVEPRRLFDRPHAYRSALSRRGWAITASSPRSARAARSACGA